MIPAYIGALIFGLTTVLYILFLLGDTLGEYAMGGKHRIIPDKNRLTIAIAIIIQLFGIIVLLQGGGIIYTELSGSVIRTACYV